MNSDSARWQWLVEQLKTKDTMVRAQALLWNAGDPKRFVELVDEQMCDRQALQDPRGE